MHLSACRDLEALLKTAYIHLQRIGKERDNLFNVSGQLPFTFFLPVHYANVVILFCLSSQSVVETTQEKDFYKEQQQQVRQCSECICVNVHTHVHACVRVCC